LLLSSPRLVRDAPEAGERLDKTLLSWRAAADEGKQTKARAAAPRVADTLVVARSPDPTFWRGRPTVPPSRTEGFLVFLTMKPA